MAYTILVVDDSLLARSYMDKALRLSGVDIDDVLLAENGVEAIELFQSRGVDAVFSGINMPEMNGFELVEKIREDDALRGVPVVIVSTERSEARIEALKRLGIREYVTKPVTPERLREVVREVLP